MKNFFIFIIILVSALYVNIGIAQPNVFDPNDPDVIFTSTNQPAVPPYGVISKWGHTNRLSWNPFSFGYKSYYFKGMAFRIKFPSSYKHNVADGKIYPSMIFFHGLGEPGPIYDNEFHLVHGGQLHAQKINDGTFDGFAIYPQSQAGYLQNYFPVLKDLVDSLVKYVKLDIDRVNIGGLSSGGQAVWDFVQQEQYAKITAALQPISAAQYEDVNYFQSHITVPIMIGNGGQDNAPYPSTVTDIINSYKNLGGDITHLFYEGLGHGVWNEFWYNNPLYFPFLNSAHKANPLIYFQHSKFCPNEAVDAKLGLQAGFFAYQWEKDGNTISGQTTNILNVNSYGTYKARFKRTSTSNWSAWSPKPAVISQNQATISPNIQVNGFKTHVLPAPDGSTTVPLMVPTGYVNYEWRRVSDNVLVSTSNTYNAPVGQYKIKVTEQFGCGSGFSEIFTVVPANGINGPDAATSVSGIAISNNSIQLYWSDNPNPAYNETAFEIYRSTTPGSGYVLAGRTGADTDSYLDNGLLANKNYYYIVRAINNNAASALSSEVRILTLSDNTPPTAPGNLVVSGSSQSSVTLSWNASTDDVAVSKYDVYVNGLKTYVTTSTTFTVNALEYLQSYSFYVKAVDASGNVSPASNQVNGTAALRGLYYKYYEGSWNVLPDFNTLTPVATGLSPNIDITKRLTDDNFSFLWEGFIKIPVTGTYTFETNSDDGSKLYIGTYSHAAVPVVDNDGLHGNQYRSGTISLNAGVYPIAITFFEKGGGENMQVFWGCAAAGIPSRTPIPNSAFVDNVTTSPNLIPQKPSNLYAVATAYNKINLNWTDNSNNELGFEVTRATSLTGIYAVIGSVGADVTLYVDSIGLNPETKYWYKLRAINQYGASEDISMLRGKWSFDNNYNDGSGNNSNFTGSGSPTFDTDRKEGSHAVSLNGFTQYLDLPFAAGGKFPSDGYSSRSIGLWMKPNSNTVNGTNKIVYEFGGSANGIALRFNGNSLQAGISRANSRSTVVLNNVSANAAWVANAWNHVATVYDANSIKLYVNATLVGSTTLSGTPVGSNTNGSRIGASNSNNAFNSSSTSTNYGGLLDDLYIVDEPIGAEGIAALMAQSYGAATTFPLPSVPVAPANIVASAVTTTSIAFQFDDNSNNESLFEVYRSAGNPNNFRLLATVAGGAGATKAYIDSNLFANSNYYYKVRAKGIGGTSAFSAEKLIKSANNLPVITAVSSFTMRYSEVKAIALSASDVDGEELVFSFKNSLPAFASFTNISNGSGSLQFSPSISQQGVYNISAVVSDQNGGKDTMDFVVTVNNNYSPVISPIGNVSLAEASNANVPLSATDQDGNSTLSWSLTNAPSFVTLTDNGNGAGSLAIAPSYQHSGVYTVVVKVTDGTGGNDSKSFTLTVSDTEPTVEKWFMSMKYNSPNAPSPWNTIATTSTAGLKNSNGQTTGVGIQFLNTNWNAGDAGAVTGNNSGVYPDAVIKDYFWFGVYGAPETVNVNLTGLIPTEKYNVTLFGSSSWTGLGNNGTTVYTINGVAKPLYVDKNSQNTVMFTSLFPNAQGIITINMSKGTATPYGLVNAIVLEKPFDDGTAPALPQNFAAQTQSNGSVKLSWKDVAYNESRYLVHRATNSAGPFTILNPGAGNANDSTYIDNTVLSSTTYFYKIEATNNVGTSGFSNVATVSTTNKAPILADFADVYVKSGNLLAVPVNATDDAGDILTVTVSGLPSFANYQSTGNGTGNINFNPSLDNLGIYPGIVVKVTDNSGASVSKFFKLTVTDNSVRSVYINFGPAGAIAQASPWNNFLAYPFANFTYGNIRDDQNVTTGFTFKTLSQWTGGLSNGMRTGNNTGVFPDDVMKTSFYNSNNGNHIIEFGGLNPSNRYSFGLLTNANVGEASEVTFSAGGQSVVMDGKYNTNVLANLNGLAPNGSGIIQVTFSKNSANPLLYLNGLVIREHGATDPVIRPADLIAETILEKDRIKLTWSDRSNDETGFQVWRATAVNGTYSLVTTTAANTTTYLNTGLSPNTRYFYKVRAVKSGTFSAYSNVADAILALSIVLINQNVNIAQKAPSPWNSTSAPSTQGAKFSNLINTNAVNTGFEMEITKEFNGAGFAGVNADGVFPANVMFTNYWTDAGQTSQVKFRNLDVSKKYRIGCFGSNTNTNFTTAYYTSNGKTVELNSYKNATKVVYLDRLVPSQDGDLVLSVTTANGSPYSFTGAYTIEYFTDNSADEPMVNTIYPAGVPLNNLIAANRVLPGNGAIGDENLVSPRNNATNVNKETVISVFPNPFTSSIQVEMENPKNASVSILLYDLNGRLVFRTNNMNVMRGNNVVAAHLPTGLKLAPGNYIINVWLDGKLSKSVKMIKVN